MGDSIFRDAFIVYAGRFLKRYAFVRAINFHAFIVLGYSCLQSRNICFGIHIAPEAEGTPLKRLRSGLCLRHIISLFYLFLDVFHCRALHSHAPISRCRLFFWLGCFLLRLCRECRLRQGGIIDTDLLGSALAFVRFPMRDYSTLSI